MYYKYKSRKRDYTVLKRIMVLVILGVSSYFVYSHRDMLMFWKIDRKELGQSLKKTSGMKNRVAKELALEKMRSRMEELSAEKLFDADVLALSATYHYEVFSHRWGRDFTSFYVDDVQIKPKKYKKLLERVIKDINKILALDSSGDIDGELRLFLARASFYLSFYDIPHIVEILNRVDFEDTDVTTDDVRFMSVVYIKSGDVERGLDLLKKMGEVKNGFRSRLFYAKALADGKKFTEAILVLKKSLKETTNQSDRIPIRMLLGKIYFEQNIFKEAAGQFWKVRELDREKVDAAIWLGKSFMKLGYVKKAKKVWREALDLFPNNRELLLLTKN